MKMPSLKHEEQMSAITLSPACPCRTPVFGKNTPPSDFSHPLKHNTHSEADLMPGITCPGRIIQCRRALAIQ